MMAKDGYSKFLWTLVLINLFKKRHISWIMYGLPPVKMPHKQQFLHCYIYIMAGFKLITQQMC